MILETKDEKVDPVELPMLGDPSAAFGDCVSSLTKVISMAVNIEIERFGLRPDEFAVMQLFCHRSEWTATQLTERTDLGPSRISRLVEQLVNRRLLRRRRSSTDRRVVNLVLTDNGGEMIAAAHSRIISYQAALLKDVSEQELSGFFATARKVIQSYAEFDSADLK
ncbi:MAG: MarR family winged helix-turn-helix transcriptional regulator [bacterium]|nr:MarR family winged helix-turn-helix transcriptional regulator [bacterium]MCY3889430.1 MarR family winged helix-turn-helix transcriptional regulator [bacterium]MCY3961486.1 MarR family winged helix-turn-helix transcriptional regulator [bacterium]MCY4135710.1 MarR family winged helix-turn-helix transcriptional regulator [bacterium]